MQASTRILDVARRVLPLIVRRRCTDERQLTVDSKQTRPGPDSPQNVAGQADAAPPLDIARLAHELRTPLGAISVLAEIMRDERLGALGNQRYRAYATDIHESAAHANAVLAAYLDSAGSTNPTGGPMAFAELDPGAIVAGAVSALEPLAQQAGVALSAQVAPGLPHVIADQRSIRQMLNNLIANALRFTPPGGSVAVAVGYEAGAAVTITIADNGDGMTPAELARLRSGDAAPAAFRRRSGGSGQGLPLVRALADANGARLAIDSVLGQGTTVSIVLPHNRVVPV